MAVTSRAVCPVFQAATLVAAFFSLSGGPALLACFLKLNGGRKEKSLLQQKSNLEKINYINNIKGPRTRSAFS